MRSVLAVLVGSLGLGCSGNSVSLPSDAPTTIDAAVDATPDAGSDPNEGATSGARIKLVWYQTPDGVKSYIAGLPGPGYYDAQRDEDCGAVRWADGNTYCTPTSMPSVYADAACTTLLGQEQRSTCATAPPRSQMYVRTTGPVAGCGSGVAHLYQRGAQVAASQYYTKNAAGTCVGPASGPPSNFYAAGTEVASTALVPMTVSEPIGAGTLQVRWWQTADGMRAVDRAYDSTLDSDCVPMARYAGSPICFLVAQPAFLFHDAACTQHEAPVATGCQVPPYAQTVTNQVCPKPTVTFFATGAQVASSPLYWNSGSNTCTAITADPANTYYSVGAEVAPTTVQYQPDTTPGHRLELQHFTAPDFSYRSGTLHDTTFGTDCELRPLDDGSVRCLPRNGGLSFVGSAGTGVVSVFDDAACTIPIDLVQVYLGPGGCAAVPTPTLIYRDVVTNGCRVPEVRMVGAVHTNPIHLLSGGVCTAYDPGSIPGVVFHDALAIVPNSSLGTATRVVDP